MMIGVLLILIKLIHFVKGTHLFLSGNINQMDGFCDIPLIAPLPSLLNIQSFQLENEVIRKKI